MHDQRDPQLTGGAGVLAGRVVLVTGASRGIGAAVARSLHAAGARPLLVARASGALDALAAELSAPAYAADVTQPAAVAELAARVAQQATAGVDGVVHAAGAFGLAPVTGTEPAEFDRMLAVNLRAAFLLMRAFLPAMVQRGRGHFVSIGSVAGRQAFASNGAYAASKYGLRGLHEVLEVELRGTGVVSVLVEPSATDTPLWDGIDFSAHPSLPARTAMLRPEGVADAVLYALGRPPEAAVHTIILDRN